MLEDGTLKAEIYCDSESELDELFGFLRKKGYSWRGGTVLNDAQMRIQRGYRYYHLGLYGTRKVTCSHGSFPNGGPYEWTGTAIEFLCEFAEPVCDVCGDDFL